MPWFLHRVKIKVFLLMVQNVNKTRRSLTCSSFAWLVVYNKFFKLSYWIEPGVTSLSHASEHYLRLQSTFMYGSTPTTASHFFCFFDFFADHWQVKNQYIEQVSRALTMSSVGIRTQGRRMVPTGLPKEAPPHITYIRFLLRSPIF